ncbi:MAG: Gfo/Idh/MocA family oxidoreductase [Phycisphaerales bacterium]|nr:Gfo/Idh/MocA family oxidoreductase [Phycisphaerales bacterium]
MDEHMELNRRHALLAGMSRRQFSHLTAATLIASPFALRAGAAPRSTQTLNIGLVGCGGRGSGAVAQALEADSNVVVTALADVFADRVTGRRNQLIEAYGDRVQVPDERCFSGFDAYQHLIDTDVDVVLLATPPYFRPSHLAAAVAAKKHIFCEKQMAVDAPGVRSVLKSAAQCRENNRCLVSGFCWRYNPPERACFAQLHNGRIGDIRAMHATYHAGPLGQNPRQPGWTDIEWQLRNWWHFDWLSGDHLVEQAVHSVDKINWAMRDAPPERITALGGRGVREGAESGNVYDHFTVIYEYADGARAFLTARQQPNCPFDNTDYVLGTHGDCFINGWGPTQRITGDDPWSYEGDYQNMYQVEHDELFAAIRADTPINDGAWMTTSTMMAIAGRMSAYTGQTLTWKQACDSTDVLGPETVEFGAYTPRPIPRPGTTPFV